MTDNRPAVIAALSALGVMLATTWVQGHWTARWSPEPAVGEASRRLESIPLVIGSWRGEDLEFDLREMGRAGIDGGLRRQYRDDRTNETVTILLVAGPPGPISVHTPEVCYQGAGFEVDTAPIPSATCPGFIEADFRKPGPIPEALRIYWSWGASGRWTAPESPRVAFAMQPALYKLYVIQSLVGGGSVPDGPAARFIREAMPTLLTVFPGGDSGRSN